MNSNWSYSPETPNFGQNRWFFVRCEIWQMTLKNNRAPLLCYFKLCAPFCSYWWIKIGVTVWKCPIRVKIDHIYFTIWYWSLGHNLRKSVSKYCRCKNCVGHLYLYVPWLNQLNHKMTNSTDIHRLIVISALAIRTDIYICYLLFTVHEYLSPDSNCYH